MKKIVLGTLSKCSIVVLSILMLSVSCFASTERLAELYFAKQYFELRDTLPGFKGYDSTQLLFYRGAVNNKFNKLEQSIDYLEKYLSQVQDHAVTPLLVETHEMLADNFFKSYRYQKAAEIYQILIHDFADTVDAKKLKDYQNSLQLCKALSDVPRQIITIEDNSKIQAIAGNPGFFPFELNGKKVVFAFDTGANLSLIVDSVARDHELKIIDVPIEVETGTGDKIQTRLAVAPVMRLGKVVVRNVVFLVVPDRMFHLKGIIGFPVLEALGEITLVGNKEVRIPQKPAVGYEQNMALSGLTPLISGEFQGQRLTFRFDTGANKSHLYPLFFQFFEEYIRSNSDRGVEKFGGVGSTKEVPAYIMKDVVISFDRKEARFPEIKVFSEYTVEDSYYFHGNIGLDLVQQFPTMTLNFRTMSIVFE